MTVLRTTDDPVAQCQADLSRLLDRECDLEQRISSAEAAVAAASLARVSLLTRGETNEAKLAVADGLILNMPTRRDRTCGRKASALSNSAFRKCPTFRTFEALY